MCFNFFVARIHCAYFVYWIIRKLFSNILVSMLVPIIINVSILVVTKSPFIVRVAEKLIFITTSSQRNSVVADSNLTWENFLLSFQSRLPYVSIKPPDILDYLYKTYIMEDESIYIYIYMLLSLSLSLYIYICIYVHL